MAPGHARHPLQEGAPQKRGFFVTVAAGPAERRSDDQDVSVKGKTVVRVTLWGLWSLWGIACLALLLGAAANALASRTQTVPLAMSPGATAQITVYRLIDDRLRLRLRYAADGTEADPDVLLRIETPTAHGAFRAGARLGVAGQGINRPLASVESSGLTASYFGYGRGDALPRGRSWLRVTVLEVDPALAGHEADIELQPPLDLLKLADLDYVWLWPFFFWKMAALFLLIAGAALAVFTWALRRWQRQASVLPTSAGDRG